MKDLEQIFILPDTRISSIISKMDIISEFDVPKGIMLVVDQNNRLLGTITDGDIRRSFIDKDKILFAKDIMNDNPLTFSNEKSFETIKEEIPKRLKKRDDTSRKFLSNIILVNKNRIPTRMIAYHELWKNDLVKNKKVSILGLGYVGITLSLALADTGIIVFGYDVDPEKIKKLSKGKMDVHEDGLDRLLKEHLNKLFFPSDSLSEDSDVYIICVSTPVEINNKNNDYKLSLKYIESAIEEIGRIIKKGSLIIMRSTIPIGLTRDHLIPIIERVSGFKCGLDFKISFAPERTVEGLAIKELRELPQVIGGYDEKSYEETAKVFSRLTSTIVHVDSLEAAEMVKLMNNSYRDYVFAYSNKLSMIASNFNLDITHVIESANRGYPRNPIPYPSPGVGGPCLTKDPYIFSSSIEGDKNNVFHLSRKINQSMHDYVVNRVIDQIEIQSKNKTSTKILICGLAFKGNPETGDLRNSSSLEVYKIFQAKNMDVYGFDHAIDKDVLIENGIKYHNLNNGIHGFDVIMFLNNHEMNIKLNFFDLVRQMNKYPIFFDGWSQFHKEEILKIRKCIYMNLSVSISSIGK